MNSITKKLEEAKFYSQIGWQVVPCYGPAEGGICTCADGAACGSPGKHPRLTKWQDKASKDESIVAGWFLKWPESNLGVRLGPASNLIDIEYDGDEGKATALELLSEVKTPSFRSKRSVHHLFAFPSSLAISKAVVHWRGLEIRFGTEKKGAQSIFPPSVHASGAFYEWITHPSQVGVADAPEWLSKAFGSDSAGDDGGMEFEMKDTTSTLENHPGENSGCRNAKLCELVGRYIATHGANAALVDQALAWASRCTPPIDQAKVLKVISNLTLKDTAEQSKASAPATPTKPREIAARPYSEIESQAVEWLWQDRLAIGKLSLLAGQPGLGKTFCAIDIAAKVSTGKSFCDGSKPPLGQVGILTAEDGAGDTIRPRLDAASANVANVFHIDGVRGKDRTEFLSLKDHLSELEAFFESKPELRLFILDPISAFMGSGCDSHVNASVRSVLGPLCELAERRRVALLGITHLSKGQAKAINAIIGSIAFVAAARSAYLVAQDPDDEKQRLFLPIKNNLASCTGLSFTIEDGRCLWNSDAVLVSADDIGESDETPRAEAKQWLESKLEKASMPAKWILAESRKDGVAEKTLRRAGKELGVVHERVGDSWSWRLPSTAKTELEAGEWLVS